MTYRGLTILVLGALCSSCRPVLKPGDPLPNLTRAERDRFDRGRAVFARTFTPDTGLGPLFNENACGACHEAPVVGGNGEEVETHATKLGPNGVCDALAASGGPVIQQQVTPALKAATGLDSEPVPDGAATGHRSSPALFGRGLLDAVTAKEILEYADPDDRNHDGISGRPNRAADGRVGRFGRKAFVPGLAEFTAGAFVIEQGITNPVMPNEETIGGRPVPAGVDPVPDPEIDKATLDLAVDFMRFLAPPSPAKSTRDSRHGGEVFEHVGCASCHLPTLRTGSNPVRALSHVKFHPYTDLLLHDLGGGGDVCLGLAAPSEFRTEPLMGLRFAKKFMHDGSAPTLEKAIEAHGGEAASSTHRYESLSEKDRARLIAFLKTL